jgi:cysteinyl-tRNA synthetase
MHIGLLTVNGEKMSKSIGNIINVHELIQQRKPEVIRMFFAQAHYRSPPDFSDKALDDVEKALDRLYRLKEKLETVPQQKKETHGSDEQAFLDLVSSFEHQFVDAMDDDFNTPQAFATLFEFVNSCNKFIDEHPDVSKQVCQQGLEIFAAIGNVLTLFQDEPQESVDSSALIQLQKVAQQYNISVDDEKNVEQLMSLLLARREQARKEKQWDVADGIRNALQQLGFEIQDTDTGPVWRKP